MQPTIELFVEYEATVDELYEAYMNPKIHAAFTGNNKVTISSKPGSAFSAFDGMLSGQTLLAVPGKMIVQRWRSSNFKPKDPDSILVLYFIHLGKRRARIELFHVNVPKRDYKGVIKGWPKYYFKPLRKYLALQDG